MNAKLRAAAIREEETNSGVTRSVAEELVNANLKVYGPKCYDHLNPRLEVAREKATGCWLVVEILYRPFGRSSYPLEISGKDSWKTKAAAEKAKASALRGKVKVVEAGGPESRFAKKS